MNLKRLANHVGLSADAEGEDRNPDDESEALETTAVSRLAIVRV